ncbi:MAG: efflux RND transporter periplasmic adaptor subunit [Candidatus Zixiibacteriota bacterium]|nr:MAG: efflux RND transporter periplasmic adaptor subunit [candidate division Zixibacteria bacterium]
MFKKAVIIGFVVVVVAGVLFFAIDGAAKKEEGYKTVEVQKGSIVDKALAVGKIEPRMEIAVKSKIPGIVRRIFVDVGDRVEAGAPLFDIGPDPTPIELTEAKRDVEIKQVAYDNEKRELDRLKSLLEKNLVSEQLHDNQEAQCESSRLRLQLAREKLSLIESGKSNSGGRNIDNMIKSPISGTVLSRLVEEGDPVVPLTSFQAGTELMTLAKMDDLIFKGNVDEIDVGKLRADLPAEIEIGALSSQEKVTGVLVQISPKAHKEEGSTLFEVEIRIDDVGAVFLRAGYSANADVIITRKEDILLIPERLITTRDSMQYVEVQDSSLAITERQIETGLSDGINVEVVSGLEVGELVVERPPKEINVWD